MEESDARSTQSSVNVGVTVRHSPAPTLWPTWYCLAALLDLRHAALLRPGDTLVWLEHATAVRHASAGSRTLTSLVAPPRARRLAARRRWASLVLASGVSVSIAVAATGLVAWSTALLGLLLPVSLFVMQEAHGRAATFSRHVMVDIPVARAIILVYDPRHGSIQLERRQQIPHRRSGWVADLLKDPKRVFPLLAGSTRTARVPRAPGHTRSVWFEKT